MSDSRTQAPQAAPGPPAARHAPWQQDQHHRIALTGWGRTAPTVAEVTEPAGLAEVPTLVTSAPPRGVIARGLGRSYNNAACNGGGRVITTTRMNKIISLDAVRGLVTCEAGVSLEQLMVAALPVGWFVPVSPGTRQVTVGGAIAADVHGKNHHRAGSFGRHVRSLDLLMADGRARRIAPEPSPDIFWATVGGMGLTGVILQATVALTKVETARVLVDTARTADIDETMACLAAADDTYGYTVAWADCLARGAAMGRSVITSGDFAALADLPAAQRRDPLRFSPASLAGAPRGWPNGLVNQRTVALMNEAWYRKAPKRRTGELQTIGAFFHPLDGIRNWNRVYGPAGFLQYQYVVPLRQEDAVRRSFELISAARAPSFVTVLKRFGPGDPGMLSFPMPGWTLALDFPARTPGLAGLLDGLDELVLAAGGRVYLAKDARVPPGVLARMYPRLGEFRELRAQIDPGGVFISDLARRLSL
jgi:decaprenylphospho-beta-D-ribofuranose 2-oxidase